MNATNTKLLSLAVSISLILVVVTDSKELPSLATSALLQVLIEELRDKDKKKG